MKAQFIYTYNSRDQEMINYPVASMDVLENEKAFLTFATQELSLEEKEDLVKISACVFTEEEVPKWYLDCNGKFFFEPKT